MGKGMGGGLPIGAFTSSKKHMKLFEKNPDMENSLLDVLLLSFLII